MGKNKLKKFSELQTFGCVLQYPRERLISEGFPLKGQWRSKHFENDNPIVLELGCGKGEYTVGLSKAEPERNFIGIDIKGARIWSGASEVEKEKIKNAAFLRTEIENIPFFFDKEEIAEIWITFPDPQMKKTRKRLTSSVFLEKYGQFLSNDGKINLKTDSPFLYEYTKRLLQLNGLEILTDTDDLYGSGLADPVNSIKTYYEKQWLAREKPIKLLSFRLNKRENLLEPETDDIEKDDYRAYPRHNIF